MNADFLLAAIAQQHVRSAGFGPFALQGRKIEQRSFDVVPGRQFGLPSLIRPVISAMRGEARMRSGASSLSSSTPSAAFAFSISATSLTSCGNRLSSAISFSPREVTSASAATRICRSVTWRRSIGCCKVCTQAGFQLVCSMP